MRQEKEAVVETLSKYRRSTSRRGPPILPATYPSILTTFCQKKSDKSNNLERRKSKLTWGFSLLVELQNSTHRARPVVSYVEIVLWDCNLKHSTLAVETVLSCFLLYTQTPSTPVVTRGSSSMSPGLPVSGEFLSRWWCPIHHFCILPGSEGRRIHSWHAIPPSFLYLCFVWWFTGDKQYPSCPSED